MHKLLLLLHLLHFLALNKVISQMWSLGIIFAKRSLGEIILVLFSCVHTEKSQNKSRNHDLQKCYQEVTFEILNLDTSYHCQAPSTQFLPFRGPNQALNISASISSSCLKQLFSNWKNFWNPSFIRFI